MVPTTTLRLDKIRVDGATQPRATLDPAAVDDYTETMRDDMKFPPLEVFVDGSEFWLADGFHRHHAARQCGLTEIECNVHQGTLEDAQWFSFAANKSHGLRRTNDDKQRAVKSALQHPKSVGLSDHQIAKHVGVAVSTIGDWRRRLEPTVGNLQSFKRVGADGRSIDTTNIGKRPAQTERTLPELEAVIEKGINEFVAVAGAVDEVERRLEHGVQPGKRLQIIMNAHKRRMIDGLSYLRGLCRGIESTNMQAIISGCTVEERELWADDVDDRIVQLRRFASDLRGGERSRGKGAA